MSERDRRDPRTRRSSRYRPQIADEAARLLIDNEAEHYLDAKKKAAKTVLHGAWARRKDLPSNGEIRDAVLRRTALSEGTDRDKRLFAMRITALEHLELLAPYNARLIGSVATGHARRGSDIDVHVFPESVDRMEQDLLDLGCCFEREEVLVRTPDGFQAYLHLHLEARFPVELSVYAPADLRTTTRSSTDGLPIDRVPAGRLRMLIEREHPVAWARWDRTGVLDWTEHPQPGPFDALLG